MAITNIDITRVRKLNKIKKALHSESLCYAIRKFLESIFVPPI